jgi:hypothetical protein
MGEIFIFWITGRPVSSDLISINGGRKMSSTTHMLGSFCTGCVAAAAAVIAVATLVTITWVLFL